MPATDRPAPRLVSPPRRRPQLRYFLTAGVLMAVSYAVLYFPYQAGSLPVRALTFYLRALARISAAAVSVFDPLARASDDLIVGRFSLRIVLDCAALDAHALLAAAVLAFPTTWRRRLAGVVAGTLIVAAVNVVRIAVLYVAGVRWPEAFHVLHEEVLQLSIILSTFLVFAGWVVWARRAPQPQPQPQPA